MYNVIISHTDPDGWVSAAIVIMYLNERFAGTTVTCFSYNYGGDTKNIESKIDELINNGQGVMIYMTDVTLPDEFMEKYAKYIWHMDHHKSIIENKPDWWNKIIKEDSAITIKDYKDVNNKQAEQVAACELVWLTLFPDRKMPLVVRLTGRYDVWDHPEDNSTYYLYDYFNTRLPDKNAAKHNAQLRYLEPWFKELFTEKGIQKALAFGKEAHKWIERLNAVSCLKNVAIMKCFNKIIALCNISANSIYFNEIIKRHPNIQGMMPFYYSPFKNQWKISCYTVDGAKDFQALEFIQQFKEKMDVLDMGGHADACGFSIDNKNIEKFLSCFKLYEEKNL